jgi:signal transduction histidine kinase
LRFASRSSTRSAVLVAAAVLGAVAAILYASSGVTLLGALRLVAAIAAASLVAVYLILAQRDRHQRIEEELAGQASFLESLIESMHAIAARGGPSAVLERACEEAQRLFRAEAKLLTPGTPVGRSNGRQGIAVPLRVRDEQIATLHLSRPRPFSRADVARATVLADFAARESENARLLEEATVREAERARLSEQLLTAEQEERRRLALFLHDGPVQSMAGMALMLDAVRDAVAPEAGPVMERVLSQHRDTIRALRDLSFHLEPVVLRDQGFRPAVQALTEQLGLEHKIAFHVDVADAEVLDEKVQAALYQIIRESVQASVRRGPPSRMSITVRQREDGGFDAELADDAPGERRRAIFAALEERARTLNGGFAVADGADGGTTVSISLPPYAAK